MVRILGHSVPIAARVLLRRERKDMEFTFANVHPEIIRAHQMVERAEAIRGAEYAYGEAVNKARVTKAQRFLSKKIRAHLGELSQEDSIALYKFLCWSVAEEAA